MGFQFISDISAYRKIGYNCCELIHSVKVEQ